MKKHLYKTGVKAAAGVMFVVTLLLFIVGAGFTLYSYEMDFFEKVPVEFQDSDLCRQITYIYLDEGLENYLMWYVSEDQSYGTYDNRQYYLDRYSEVFSEENTNLRFIFYDSGYNQLLSNFEGKKPDGVRSVARTLKIGGSDGGLYNIECFVDTSGTAMDEYKTTQRFYDTIYSLRYAAVAIMVISGLAFAGLLIFVMSTAGRRPEDGELHKKLLERIPLELVIWFDISVFLIQVYLLESIGVRHLFFPTLFCVALGFAAIDAALLLGNLSTIAIRYKCGELLKGTIIYMTLHWISKSCRNLGRRIRRIIYNIPTIWRLTIILLAIGLLGIIIASSAVAEGSVEIMMLGVLLYVIVALASCSVAIQFNSVKQGGKKIAGGDFSYRIPSAGLSHDIAELAESLNGISEAFSKAVDDRMKSERMKAELITNVSHDIKTPLTSIISYVDLLKKEKIEGETAREYIEVIERQAARLKKLTVDLIEASKASTGNISVDAGPMHITELLGQSVAEYSERLDAAGLTPIILSADDDMIMADGKLMWRVFDNLLANICKYSQPNTRVYINVTGKSENVEIVLKNISRDSLSVSTEDLMQRFVRGDSARSSEGSGLGLSITESLVQLQGGRFKIEIDGDLFKAILSFRRIEASAEAYIGEAEAGQESGVKALTKTERRRKLG